MRVHFASLLSYSAWICIMQGVFYQLQLKLVCSAGAVCCSIKIQRQFQMLADSRVEIKLLHLRHLEVHLMEKNLQHEYMVCDYQKTVKRRKNK